MCILLHMYVTILYIMYMYYVLVSYYTYICIYSIYITDTRIIY